MYLSKKLGMQREIYNDLWFDSIVKKIDLIIPLLGIVI